MKTAKRKSINQLFQLTTCTINILYIKYGNYFEESNLLIVVNEQNT